eukprot:UN10054
MNCYFKLELSTMALKQFLSLFAMEKQQPTKAQLWTKIAIVAGSIGAVVVVCLLPISITKKQNITINKSSTQVYNYITQQTDAGLFWAGMHPKISSATVTKQSKKKLTLDVYEEIVGFPT